MTKFEITTSRTGDRRFEMGRVNVFLGANGTGKTKLLNELKGNVGQFLPDCTPINIEGGRSVQMWDSLELTPQNFGNFKTFDQIMTGFRGSRGKTITSRLFHALKALEQMGVEEKLRHSDAVVEWYKKGQEGDPPASPTDPMARVFEIFNDIFPAIRLSYNSSNRRLRCHKGSNEYGPTSLSDGEKQVFSILADVIEFTDENSVLFVDEPELNLNPGLANRLWSSIESTLPNAVFIYATHSVSFAQRETVDNVVVLSNDDVNIQELAELDDLSIGDQQALLGNIPSLLAQPNTLVVEGDDESFDSILYQWLLPDVEFAPSAVGSGDDVVAIATREGKWRKISPNVCLTGVVDRDYKSDEEIDKLEGKGIIVLAYHEAENYLCKPELLHDLIRALGTVATVPSVDELAHRIFQYVDRSSLAICAKRAEGRLRERISPSVPSRTLGKIRTYNELEEVVVRDVRDQMARAEATFDEENVKALVHEEWNRLDELKRSKSVEAALQIIPGKELLSSFTSVVGVVDRNGMVRAARHHLNFESYGELARLREALRGRMGFGDS